METVREITRHVSASYLLDGKRAQELRRGLAMTNRALLFTTGSIFARAVRIVLDELCLDYERREEITTPAVEDRAKATPTLQVPTFWDGDVHLWESTLIIEYLLSKYDSRTPEMPTLARGIARQETY